MSERENGKRIIPEVEIGADLRTAAPDLKLGVIMADVETTRNDETWKVLDEEANLQKEKFNLDNLSSEQSISAARSVYKRIGKDPSRYRVSSEALIRRALQGKELYRINNVVDVNNIVSIRSCFSVGSYDLDKISGNVSFRVGKNGETYKGIGKELINIEGLPVFVDNEGPFGSPTSDSERTMITTSSKRIMMVLISFAGEMDGKLKESLLDATSLLQQFTSAKNVKTRII